MLAARADEISQAHFKAFLKTNRFDALLLMRSLV